MLIDILRSDSPGLMKIIELCIFILTIAISLTMHEFMHGWAAYKCGDSTAKEQGRLSFNPLVHFDPVGVIMMLFVGFGWAKPVMINPGRMNRFKKRDTSVRIVSLAGVAANFALAFISYFLFIILKIVGFYQNISFNLDASGSMISFLLSILYAFLYIMFISNLMLLAFNLIPIPPLDGFRVVETFLPTGIRYKLNSMGRNLSYIIFAIMIIGRSTNMNLLGSLVNYISIPFQYAIQVPLDKLFEFLILR